MKFSIIIPCYKVEQYLRQCIESVLAQTFEDYEIILVNDGSPDKTPAICDEYGAQNNNVKVVHKQNGGLSDARNVGLDVAQGEYVMFLDSDDWWDDNDALYKINASITETGDDITIFGMKKYFCQDNRYGDIRTPKKCDKGNCTLSHAQMQQYMRSNIFVACACDKVVRRALIEKDKQRFVKCQTAEDIEWCCKLLLKSPQIGVLEESFYVYRQQVPTSITANVGPKSIGDILDIISRYAKEDAPAPLLHFLANQYVLLLVNLMRLQNEKEREPFDMEIKKFWWIVDYNLYPYVRIVSRVKILGYSATKRLLGFYYHHKHRR